jgi:hypothetical protein
VGTLLLKMEFFKSIIILFLCLCFCVAVSFFSELSCVFAAVAAVILGSFLVSSGPGRLDSVYCFGDSELFSSCLDKARFVNAHVCGVRVNVCVSLFQCLCPRVRFVRS